jgi:hypothetical protein
VFEIIDPAFTNQGLREGKKGWGKSPICKKFCDRLTTNRQQQLTFDGQRWVAGLGLEHLVALGEAALLRGTIAEVIDALERELARESRRKGQE